MKFTRVFLTSCPWCRRCAGVPAPAPRAPARCTSGLRNLREKSKLGRVSSLRLGLCSFGLLALRPLSSRTRQHFSGFQCALILPPRQPHHALPWEVTTREERGEEGARGGIRDVGFPRVSWLAGVCIFLPVDFLHTRLAFSISADGL